MKKTYTINLSGKVFHIDEDAFEKLQSYINTLKNHYTKESDGTEIMYDIESRISELFTEYQKQNFRESIILEDVEKIITTMGKPADIIEEEEEEEEPKAEIRQEKQPRKLYRNPDHRVLGGVASGLGTYWKVSTILLRVIFLLLSLYYGVFILIYLILWIAIPIAKTSKEKLEMKGKDINVPNIERSVKEEYKETKKSRIGRFFGYLGEFIGKIFIGIGRIIKFIFSLFLLLFGIASLLTFITITFAPNITPWADEYEQFIFMLSPFSAFLFKVCIFFLTAIPALVIIFLALKLLIPFKNKKSLLLPTGLIWIFSLFILLIVGLSEAQNFSGNGISINTSIPLNLPKKKLIIDVNRQYNINKSYYNRSRLYKIRDEKESFLISPLRMDAIKPKQGIDEPTIVISRYTQASSYMNEKELGIHFNYEIKNDTLRVDNYYRIDGPFRGQRIDFTIYLPKNYEIEYTNNVDGNNRVRYYE